MEYTPGFFNAVCFIILTCLIPVFTFYIQGVLKLKKKSGAKRLKNLKNCKMPGNVRTRYKAALFSLRLCPQCDVLRQIPTTIRSRCAKTLQDVLVWSARYCNTIWNKRKISWETFVELLIIQISWKLIWELLRGGWGFLAWDRLTFWTRDYFF